VSGSGLRANNTEIAYTDEFFLVKPHRGTVHRTAVLRVLAILPIVGPVGNMGPVLCAFSYAGQLFLIVTADARGFPDLDVLMAGMESDGHALLGGNARPRPRLWSPRTRDRQ